MKQILFRLCVEDEGQDLTEYALLITLIAIAMIGVLGSFSRAIVALFSHATSLLSTSSS
jgi:Flp pilus assembly pilin Flp